VYFLHAVFVEIPAKKNQNKIAGNAYLYCISAEWMKGKKLQELKQKF
jgi:hypothetical protein